MDDEFSRRVSIEEGDGVVRVDIDPVLDLWVLAWLTPALVFWAFEGNTITHRVLDGQLPDPVYLVTWAFIEAIGAYLWLSNLFQKECVTLKGGVVSIGSQFFRWGRVSTYRVDEIENLRVVDEDDKVVSSAPDILTASFNSVNICFDYRGKTSGFGGGLKWRAAERIIVALRPHVPRASGNTS